MPRLDCLAEAFRLGVTPLTKAWGAPETKTLTCALGTYVAEHPRMTRPRRSTPGIAFAATGAGRFQSGPRRETLDIVAVGRHVEAASRTRRALSAAGGAALVALALVPRGVVGALLAIGGAMLLVRSATGKSLGESMKTAIRRLRARAEDVRIDRASEESFPASDPPAHSH
jgi:hypothetical protein